MLAVKVWEYKNKYLSALKKGTYRYELPGTPETPGTQFIPGILNGHNRRYYNIISTLRDALCWGVLVLKGALYMKFNTIYTKNQVIHRL